MEGHDQGSHLDEALLLSDNPRPCCANINPGNEEFLLLKNGRGGR